MTYDKDEISNQLDEVEARTFALTAILANLLEVKDLPYEKLSQSIDAMASLNENIKRNNRAKEIIKELLRISQQRSDIRPVS